MPDYAHLRVDTAPDGVRTLTLDRAEKLNAVNGALADSFASAVADAAAEDDVRVLVITGAGRAFCAGLDLSEPPALPDATRAERLDPYAWVGTWVRRLLACEKPVIAAVNGPAAGAGLGLALACDLRLVADSARLTAGYVRRGLSPDAGVSWLLPRHVGLATASVPDAELAERVRSLASQLAAGPPIAHALTKRLLARSLDTPLDAALRDELVYIKECFATRDVAEAIAAFREKRPPVFRGR